MRHNIRRAAMLLGLISFIFTAFAQAPEGYYRNSKGKSGAALKTALYGIIGDHTARSYDNLWTDFGKTDLREDGKIWDMYSNISNYTLGKDQHGKGGNNGVEGGCYNREHSFPKSWFNDAKPMYTDLFHLYPTDAKINSMRSNFPFGETNKPKSTSKNGFSKLGPCSTPGYSGMVFEPNDEYKGDFARTYFYMATAYEGRFSSFNSPMLSGDSYPCYKKWALDMLLRWAKEDPVSKKEIDRNNAVYKIQKNRNPYIDYPGLEQYVWGNKKDTTFDPDNYEQHGGGGGGTDPEPTPQEVAAPVFSMSSGIVPAGTEITISCATDGATIYYTVNNGNLQTGYAPVHYTIQENSDIDAYAMLGDNKSQTVSASYTVSEGPVTGSDVYVKVNSENELTVGTNYLIVCEGKNVAMSGYLGAKKDVRNAVQVTIDNSSITTDVNQAESPYTFTLSGNPQGYVFYDATNQGYLALTNDGNKLYTLAENNSDETKWIISIDVKGTHVYNVKYNKREIMYNSGSPRFATYTGSQQPVALYKQTLPEGIEYVEAENGKVDVYSLNGRLVRKQVQKDNAMDGLPSGIYIIGGIKVIIR